VTHISSLDNADNGKDKQKNYHEQDKTKHIRSP
jgi:hypothetical protein